MASSRSALVGTIAVLALAGVGALISLRSQPGRVTDLPDETVEPTEQPTALPTPPLPAKGGGASVERELADASRLFTVRIPADWRVTRREGGKGIQLSRIDVESPDFVLRTDESVDGPFVPQYYERGAALSIRVTRGALAARENLEAGTQRTERIAIDGHPSLLRVFTEPSTALGQIIDAQVDDENTSTVFSIRYNPDTYPQGERVFKEILASFRFTR